MAKQVTVKNRDNTQKPAHKQPAPTKQSSFWSRNNKSNLYIAMAMLATIVIYFQNIFHDFTLNWDDGGYIVVNEVIHKLSFENLKIIFSTFDKGNYHPLTTLMYAFEYALAGDNAMLYHINNIIIHLFNIYLVFLLIMRLSKRTEAAFIVALFFGIHPMHVESVAWISERKDVLYTMFMLLTALLYHRFIYVKNTPIKFYFLSLLYFVLALMSKSAAVVTPVVLVLMDYYLKRPLTMRSISEKIPFFALSLLFGILAIMSQDSAGAIQDLTPMFTIPERFMLASYALIGYIAKLFAPFNLSAMYPYPDRIGDKLPMLFYLAPILVMALSAAIIFLRKKLRFLPFGALFYVATIFLVIQLLPVGGALMAERYTYVPYIGLFFIIAMFYIRVKDNFKRFESLFRYALLAFALYCGIISYNRVQVWENGEILFTDVIEKYPNLPFAYNNRGYFYFRFGEDYFKENGVPEPKKTAYDKAYADFTKCINIDARFDKAFSNRAVLLYNSDRQEEALSDFDACLNIKPDNTDALIGRANTLSYLKQFEKAIPDYDNYIKLKTDDEKAYLWRATALYNTGRYEEALKDLEVCFSFNPQNAEAFYWRGLVFYQQKKFKESIDDFNTSIRLNPDKPEVYTWRGLAYYYSKDLISAVADYSKSIEINPNDAPAYVNRSIALHELGRNQEAFEDINKAGQLGYPLDRTYFMKLLNIVEKK